MKQNGSFPKKTILMIGVSFVVVLGILLVLVFKSTPKDSNTLRVPDLTYETLTGSMRLPVPPTEKGYTLLYFWATWSPVCYDDLKVLSELVKKTPRYSVMTVAVDGKGHSRLGSIVEQHGITFPVAIGDVEFVKKIVDAPGVPLLLVVDKRRVVVRSYLGSINPQVLAELGRGDYVVEAAKKQ